MPNYNSRLKALKLIPAPELPKEAQLPSSLQLEGCSWLDQYVEFSQKWSPRSFDGYHEAAGLWILSTIAARRIEILFGREMYTNLYMLLVGRTSLYAKTTVVQIAKDFIYLLDLSYFLLPDECTPQKMIQEMSTRLPQGFKEFSASKQVAVLNALTFVGQRGWYYDEFGANIQNMMKKDGPYSEFRGILRKFHDTELTYIRGTITRGNEEIVRPYLSLLGALTPADISPVAYRGSMLWGDGYLARMGLIVPPAGLVKDGEFPPGKRSFEESLINPIRDWHNRLGMPKIQEQNGQIKRDFSLMNSSLELSKETRAAYYQYDTALRKILISMGLTDLDGNYARFAEKSLRIAGLFASLGGFSEIEISHWAKAQAITERWRSNLHSLYKQVNEEFTVQAWTDGQKVVKAINERINPTAREIQQYTGLNVDVVTHELDELQNANKLIIEQVGKATRYRISK